MSQNETDLGHELIPRRVLIAHVGADGCFESSVHSFGRISLRMIRRREAVGGPKSGENRIKQLTDKR